MKLLPVFVIALLAIAPAVPSRDYPIRAVPLTAVTIDDGFWAPKLEINRTVTIPHILKENDDTGRVANFEKAAGKKSGSYEGRRFNDTDVFKIIEAASYSLALVADPRLSTRLDELIQLIAESQQKDGYLFPARTIDPEHPAPGVGPERWIYENGSHELYNAGHLYEAAVAHFKATGKRSLLEVAIRNADLVCRTFGPTGRHAVPGHEEIELALVKLYRATGTATYLQTAEWFVAERGKPHPDMPPYPDKAFEMYNDRAYKQDQAPVVEQDRAVGHAVRAMYLYEAVTDVAALTSNDAFAKAADRLWQDVVSKRLYLTGGVGARGTTESFGEDYELPNLRAYTETCASVGNDLWNHKMFLLHGDGKYIDLFERVLYNGVLAGVSLAGNTFFYQNPLESNGRARRTEYFEVACCPANLARMLEQLPELVYAQTDDTIYANLYVGNHANVTVGNRQREDRRGHALPVGRRRLDQARPGGLRRLHDGAADPRLVARHAGAERSLPLCRQRRREAGRVRAQPQRGAAAGAARRPRRLRPDQAQLEARRHDPPHLADARASHRRARGCQRRRGTDGDPARPAGLRRRGDRQRRPRARSRDPARRGAPLALSRGPAERRRGHQRRGQPAVRRDSVLRLEQSRPGRDGGVD